MALGSPLGPSGCFIRAAPTRRAGAAAPPTMQCWWWATIPRRHLQSGLCETGGSLTGLPRGAPVADAAGSQSGWLAGLQLGGWLAGCRGGRREAQQAYAAPCACASWLQLGIDMGGHWIHLHHHGPGRAGNVRHVQARLLPQHPSGVGRAPAASASPSRPNVQCQLSPLPGFFGPLVNLERLDLVSLGCRDC